MYRISHHFLLYLMHCACCTYSWDATLSGTTRSERPEACPVGYSFSLILEIDVRLNLRVQDPWCGGPAGSKVRALGKIYWQLQ